MDNKKRISNRLINETSPYLLQHAENPVDWYPWGEEAFRRAKREDKPVFLSVGYSSCHWCHVMARESFEDADIADVLNRYFVCVKVDREERPDVDSVYMAVCQAFTGSGGWPMSVFMTAEQLPFFAGTYFPKTSRMGMIGFRELLVTVHEKWESDREALLSSGKSVIAGLAEEGSGTPDEGDLIEAARWQFEKSYDAQYGGFGRAPKFPSAHNISFLLNLYRKRGDEKALEMAENTLKQMYRGGLFDHIGFGFCRYSTDRYFLAPHFEKMLYDNALLIGAYCEAYELTRKPLYLDVAEKTAEYVLAELTSPQGGFYSAQDADSEGEEGGYYLFRPEEITQLLGGEEGERFNSRFDITKRGNFEGRSIPNLLKTDALSGITEEARRKVYEYRRKRYPLFTDDKILTGWNGLMMEALCSLYRVSRKEKYLTAAKKAVCFIERELCCGDRLYASAREGRRGEPGFLFDYAAHIAALISLYGATLKSGYLSRAEELSARAVEEFFDRENGGFYLYGKTRTALILTPKESYDGALPSGNSLMTWDLVRIYLLSGSESVEEVLQKQLDFMCARAGDYPAGYSMFLTALSDWQDPPATVTAVTDDPKDIEELPFAAGLSCAVRLITKPTEEYPQKEGRTTFYICRSGRCLPPTNDWSALDPRSGGKEE